MQMNVAGLRRNIKNLAHNYSDAQVSDRACVIAFIALSLAINGCFDNDKNYRLVKL